MNDITVARDANKETTAGHRLFIGISCPPLPAIRNLLEELQQSSQRNALGLRIAREANLHITLKFIGATATSAIPQINAVMERQLADIRCFDLHPQGLGNFPGLLWLGVAPAPVLMALAAKLDSALADSGVSAETRPFVPHISVAWLGRETGFDSEEWLRNYQHTSWGAIRVEAVSLYESVLVPEGVHYLPLHTVQLMHPPTVA